MRLLAKILLTSSLLLPSTSALAEVVAFAQDDMKNDFRRAQVAAVREHLAQYPEIEFRHSDAHGRTSLFIEQVESFIADKVDVIIIGAADAEASVPVVEKAYAAGIGVIVLDRGVATDKYSSFINSDNVAIGRKAARFLADQLNGKGRVLLLEGLPRADVTKDRSAGFLSVMAQYPDIKIIRRTGNYLRRDALREMEQLLADDIQLDAIFSGSDSMLSGVRAAMAYHDQAADSLITIGCDYISEARSAILRGDQTASIIFPLGSREAAETAYKLIHKVSVPHHQVIGNVQLVTKDNAAGTPAIF